MSGMRGLTSPPASSWKVRRTRMKVAWLAPSAVPYGFGAGFPPKGVVEPLLRRAGAALHGKRARCRYHDAEVALIDLRPPPPVFLYVLKIKVVTGAGCCKCG